MPDRTKRAAGGRPPKFDRETVIASLAGEFRKRGYAAPTIAELARAAHVNRPTLAASFGERQDLYRLASHHFASRMRAALQEALAESETRAAFDKLMSSVIDLYLPRDSDLRGCLVFSTAPASTDDPVVADILQRMVAELDSSLRSELIRRVETGEAFCLPPENAADLIAAVIHSMAVRARAGSARSELEALAHSLRQAVFPKVVKLIE